MEPLLDSMLMGKLDRLALVTRRAMAGDRQGERRSTRRGASVEFADFRPYTPGDDIRQIDWNLYARMEKFFLKLFVAEEELTVHLLLDSSRSMDWGEPPKFAYAQRMIAALGYLALSSLDRVTVAATGGTLAKPLHTLPGVRGKRGVFPLVAFLQTLEPSSSVSLAAVCQHYARSVRTPGPLLLCSDLLEEGWRDALRALTARRFEITLLHVLAPQEIRPQLEGDVRLVDSEGGPPVEITADAETLQRYQANLAAWRSEIETFCQGRAISYLFVDTSVPLEEYLVAQLRARGVVR